MAHRNLADDRFWNLLVHTVTRRTVFYWLALRTAIIENNQSIPVFGIRFSDDVDFENVSSLTKVVFWI